MIDDPVFTVSGLEAAGMVVPEVRFEEEIAAFQRADAEAPPEPGGILFVGDSDIRFWNAEGVFDATFGALGAINRGFGGARTWETLVYFPRIVLPYRPRTIVYNAGDNDVSALKAEGPRVAELGVRLFLDAVARHLPETERFLYLAIHPAPCNEAVWGCQREADDRIRALCEASPMAEHLDYLHLIHDNHGKLRPEIFLADRLHYAPGFYRELGAWLRPRLGD